MEDMDQPGRDPSTAKLSPSAARAEPYRQIRARGPADNHDRYVVRERSQDCPENFRILVQEGVHIRLSENKRGHPSLACAASLPHAIPLGVAKGGSQGDLFFEVEFGRHDKLRSIAQGLLDRCPCHV